MDPMPQEIGRALRRARLARRLTLREVFSASGGRFKATSVAGYERGERSITLKRFCELCRVYGVAPERLLADIVRAAEGRTEPEIDLSVLQALGTPEGSVVAEFVRQVRSLRGEQDADTIVLRAGDLEVLATASGRRPDELIKILRPVLRRKR